MIRLIRRIIWLLLVTLVINGIGWAADIAYPVETDKDATIVQPCAHRHDATQCLHDRQSQKQPSQDEHQCNHGCEIVHSIMLAPPINLKIAEPLAGTRYPSKNASFILPQPADSPYRPPRRYEI